MKHKIALALGAAFLSTVSAGGVLISATPAAADEYDQVTCKNYKLKRTSWSADCTVPYGHARAMAGCYDGTEHYGAWVGKGRYKFGISCGNSKLAYYDVEARKN
ncbi:hypothetical protein [Streptomyces botrytidirepellens]|uniref:Uncharacterized protein n=1 Tax=Streptomyces botrytidirepellens TaxID=2486417 RepID=A0A3M8SG61_9ACTN|nr:hypothetical protein [Streptomyces botrytidirepellens]RNF78154.1 hypothetical protein EEJ42_49065 [Streptomyces botrytidirepellens]